MTSRNWCFTIHVSKERKWEPFQSLPESVKYIVFQLEKCPKTGKKHYQGFLQTKDPIRIGGAKKLLKCDWAHLEVTKGSPEQNRKYCSKSQTRVGETIEFGTLTQGRGARTDLARLHSAIKQGKSFEELMEIDFGACLRYSKGIEKAISMYAKNIDTPKKVYLYWGDSGTGKSKSAAEKFPEAWWKPEGEWFDGYEGQNEVIIDDFTPGSIKTGLLLKLLDRYPLRVPVKGGFKVWKPKKIIITSNYPIEEWKIPAKSFDAVKRRIHVIKHFVSDDVTGEEEDETEEKGDSEAVIL